MNTDKIYPIGGYAPGEYVKICTTCKQQFIGDKRAVQCEPCAIKMVIENHQVIINTDKQPETVYTPFDLNSEIKFSLWGKKHENVYIFTPEELEALKAKWEKEQWISVKDKLPEIDINDNWNKKIGQSKDVWTYSDFGMKKGRYFHHGEHSIWRIDGASCTNGIEVTHWMPLPKPPKK